MTEGRAIEVALRRAVAKTREDIVRFISCWRRYKKSREYCRVQKNRVFIKHFFYRAQKRCQSFIRVPKYDSLIILWDFWMHILKQAEWVGQWGWMCVDCDTFWMKVSNWLTNRHLQILIFIPLLWIKILFCKTMQFCTSNVLVFSVWKPKICTNLTSIFRSKVFRSFQDIVLAIESMIARCVSKLSRYIVKFLFLFYGNMSPLISYNWWSLSNVV